MSPLHRCMGALPALVVLLFPTMPALAQWTWLHPDPQGNYLRDVTFLDETTAISVGDAGTILVSHDAGTTWTASHRVNDVSSPLVAIARVDASTAIVAGYLGQLLKTTDAGTSWISIPATTGAPAVDVDFRADLGLLAIQRSMSSPVTLMRSADGGYTWSPVFTDLTVNAVDIVTDVVAVAVTSEYFLRSEDGGQTWSETFLPPLLPLPTTILSAVSFVDPLHGAVGAGDWLLVTDDGGVSWTPVVLDPGVSHVGVGVEDVTMADAQTMLVATRYSGCDGVGVCASGGMFFRSSDGGSSWSLNWSGPPLHAVTHNGSGVALLAGDLGTIDRFNPPGTWTQLAGSLYDDYPDGGRSSFADPDHGLIVAASDPYFLTGTSTIVFRTSDGGATWQSKGLFGARFNDVKFTPSGASAYTVGRRDIGDSEHSTILKSEDNGASWSMVWSVPTTATTGELRAISFSSDDHAVAVGWRGALTVLDNDVATAGLLPDASTFDYLDVAFADATHAVAVGGAAGAASTPIIARSSDGGSTWERMLPVPSPSELQGVGFATPLVGIAVGGSSMLRSEDGGLTWQTVSLSPPAHRLYSVAFASPMHGMAVGAEGPPGSAPGGVFETSDGGLTWARSVTPTSSALSDVAFLEPFHAIVSGPDLLILEYQQSPLPTLISSFEVSGGPGGAVLNWSVHDDSGLSHFEIRRRGSGVEEAIATALYAAARSYRDESTVPGGEYQYRLLAVDLDGTAISSAPVTVTIPEAQLSLLPNVPNPFNPSTTLRFVVPERARVTLTIYDVAGRRVTTLVAAEQTPGMHEVEWNGTDANGNPVASGVYVSRLRVGTASISRTLVLLK